MAGYVRITSECDGLRSAHPDGERLYRFAVGTELRLLREDARLCYKVGLMSPAHTAAAALPAFEPWLGWWG